MTPARRNRLEQNCAAGSEASTPESLAASASPDGLPPLREVIRAHGLSAQKSLGQNFILNLNLTRRIARTAGPLAGRTVIEVGPGPGGLTRALLLEGAARVIAIERDPRCLAALAAIEERFPGRLTVVAGDALEVSWPDLVASAAGKVRVAANLPYNIATRLLVRWLEAEPWPPWYERLVLMFQKEVAERIVAQPGTKAYGRLAVLSQWRARPRLLFTLPPEAFTPPPKVSSALVEIVPAALPAQSADVEILGQVTAAAFGQRRKMLRSSLAALAPDPGALLSAAGIDGRLRAEDLDVAGFVRLAYVWERLGGRKR